MAKGESANGDGTKTARWSLEKPCPSYLCCIAAGDFTRCDDGEVDGVPIAYFAPARFDAATLKRSFGRTGAMMRWIVKRLGRPFPYPKYFQVAVPGVGGAMENISLVMWDSIFLQDEALHAEAGENVDATNIHEMAHSYFGDDVVCRHFEHSWLKESWAVYVETAYWYETAGKDAGDWDLHVNARHYMEEADQRYVRPLVTRTYNSSWDLFDAHLYPGGAWRLHMLKEIVGDDAFWGATTDYLATYSGRVVETDDFRRKVEEHAGLNLTRFFDQWIHGRGYPKLKASFRHDAKKDEGTVTIEQTQENKDKQIGLFSFDLEIDVEDDAGWTTHSIRVDDKRSTAVFQCVGKPKQVRIDPRSKVLFGLEFNPGEDLLKRTLTDAEDLRGRIHAAEELISTGTRANLRAVDEAMAREPFWGVRAAVADALGKSGCAEAIGPLAAMLGREADPRAKRLVAKACGAMRDPRLRDALRAFLDEGPPPMAAAQALQALGSQRDPADLPRLEKASRDPGLHAWAASGALRGMGALRSRDALESLEARLPYGAIPEDARPAAVEGLAAGARLFERDTRARALDRLADLTRDRDRRVRLRTAAQIGTLGLAEGAGAL